MCGGGGLLGGGVLGSTSASGGGGGGTRAAGGDGGVCVPGGPALQHTSLLVGHPEYGVPCIHCGRTFCAALQKIHCFSPEAQ